MNVIKELWHGNMVPFRSENVSLAEEAMFTYAFKLGMRIAIKTLTDNNYKV